MAPAAVGRREAPPARRTSGAVAAARGGSSLHRRTISAASRRNAASRWAALESRTEAAAEGSTAYHPTLSTSGPRGPLTVTDDAGASDTTPVTICAARAAYAAGRMFWLMRKRFAGSQLALIRARRS